MHMFFLSPHRDDIAFSMGGTCFLLKREGLRRTVVTAFTQSVYAPGLQTDDLYIVCEIRQREDIEFAERIAATTIDLGRKEAPLRGYTVDEFFGAADRQLTPIELEESRNLASTIPAPPDEYLVFAPLGVGGHSDHLITKNAAFLTYARDRIVLYEDLPYAAHEEVSEHINTNLLSHVVPIDDLAPKMRAVGCYRSQIHRDWYKAIFAYGQNIGGERFWGTEQALERLKKATEWKT